MRSWRTRSAAETRRLGEGLAAELAPAGLVLLVGDLGSGKTVLTQGIARGLGIDPAEVQSPTFTLIREHQVVADGEAGGAEPQRLVHIDLYRLEPGEVVELGLEEIFDAAAVKVVEWADRLPQAPAADMVLALARGEAGDERQVRELEPDALTRSGRAAGRSG